MIRHFLPAKNGLVWGNVGDDIFVLWVLTSIPFLSEIGMKSFTLESTDLQQLQDEQG